MGYLIVLMGEKVVRRRGYPYLFSPITSPISIVTSLISIFMAGGNLLLKTFLIILLLAGIMINDINPDGNF